MPEPDGVAVGERRRADDAAVVFVRGMDDRDVWKLDLGRPPVPFLASSAGDQGAQFSPDGTRIAYQSGRWSRVGEILVTRADGTNPVQLTDGLGLQQGNYVKERVPSQPLFARPTGGGPERRVVDEILGRTFAVVEDGLYYFTRTEAASRTSLRFLEVARGRSREVARLDLPVLPGLGLTVSPDRKTFLFIAFKPDDADLFLVENFR